VGCPEFYKGLKYIVFRRSFKLVGFGPLVNFTKGSVSRELEIYCHLHYQQANATCLTTLSWTSSSQILSNTYYRNDETARIVHRLRETDS
jgi:hypothetical protein